MAWQVACQYHQQLPELPAALTDMLGVDRPLLAWLAVQDAAAGERLGTARYAAAVADLIMPGHRHAVEEELAEPPPTQQTAQGDHHQQQSLLQQQQQHELHLFLAPLLFECAAGVEDGLSTIFRRDAHHIALTSAIHSLERYVEFITFQRYMDSLKLLDSNTAPQAAAAAAPALPQPSLAVQRLAAAVPFLEKILPPLLRLTARKLAAVRAMEAAASHGSSGSRLAAAASPAAALGRRSNDSSATAAAAVAADSFKQSHWFLVHSVSLLAHLSDSFVLLLPPSPGEARSSSTSSSTSSEGTSAGLVSGAGIAKAWSINALQLTALCEGYLRALAAATSQSTAAAAAAAAAQGTLAAATAQGAIGSTVVDLLPKEGPWAVGLMSHWCSVGGRVDNSIPNLLVMAIQGPGELPLCGPTPGHKRLLGLVSSLVKLTGCQGFMEWGSEDALVARYNAALSCCSMLQLMVQVAHSNDGEGDLYTSEEQQQHVVGVAAGSPSAAFPRLAWLVLFGRVCSQWGDLLAGFDPAMLSLQRQPRGHVVRVLRLLAIDSRHRMAGPLGSVAEWLQLHEGALTAAGYSVQRVAEQLGVLQQRWQAACEAVEGQTAAEEAGAAREAASAATEAAAAVVVVAELSESLRVFGAAVSSALPLPHFCNNPGCRNVSGDLEVALVSGHSCICAGCKVARYCGRSCQRASWKAHKPVCHALAAAAAAAQAGAGGSMPA